MLRWLAAAAALWLPASVGAQAQMKGLGALEVAEVAKNRTLDLRISPEPIIGGSRPSGPNMLVHRDLGPNAALGLGLATMYKRKGNDFSTGDRAVRSRKPAVTFQMKF
jgi:hypothetical protein